MRTERHLKKIGSLLYGLVLIGGILSAKVSEAATYYVAKTGSNSNTCTRAQSLSSPKLAINSGVACLSAGDTLYVRSGTYAEALLGNIPGGTSWSSPVTVAVYPGDTVTIQPPVGTAAYRVIEIDYETYIIINGFILDAVNVHSGGEVVKIYSDHNRLINNEIKNGPSTGVTVNALAVGVACCNEFIHNKVHDNGIIDHWINENDFYIQSMGNLIEGNDIYGGWNGGITTRTDASYKHVDNNIIRYNYIHDNGLSGSLGKGGCITLNGGDNNQAYNNICANNGGSVSVGQGIAVNDSTNTKIYNNTIYKTAAECIAVASSGSGTIIKNNICWQGGGGITNRGTSSTISNNLTTNPSFINAAGNDYRLQTTSAAIDAGVTLGAVPDDFISVSRPQGAAYDIGAYEYVPAQVKVLALPTNLQAR